LQRIPFALRRRIEKVPQAGRCSETCANLAKCSAEELPRVFQLAVSRMVRKSTTSVAGFCVSVLSLTGASGARKPGPDRRAKPVSSDANGWTYLHARI
jgi:hypothetical protein